METVLLASYTGSGVAWLLNLFLELDVLVFRGNDLACTWITHPERNSNTLQPKEEVLKQWFPVLSDRQEFHSQESFTVRWAHEFPSSKNITKKVIYLVRDGRDTIFSQYKRESTSGTAFQEMLQTRLEPLDLPPAETWAAHAYLWHKLIPTDRLHIIRFEDIKTDPLPVVKRLLTFLGMQRSDEEIQRAITSSSFERAKQAEAAYRAQSTKTQFGTVNRKGQPGEWKTNYTPEALRSFTGLPMLILNKFEYETNESTPCTGIRYHISLNIKKIQIIFRWLTRIYIRSVIQHPMQRLKNTIKRTLLASGVSTEQLQKTYNLRKHLKTQSRSLLYSLLYIIHKPTPPKRKDGKIFIHLGCGTQSAEGWTNIDVAAFPHIHYRQDISQLSQFPDKSVDFIYACHVLEHINHAKTMPVLKEWRRILKDGGRLRISVPDFEQLLIMYQENQRDTSIIMKPLMGGQDYAYNYHKSIFSSSSLTRDLQRVGFTAITEFNPNTGPTNVFDDWSKRMITINEHTYKISLTIEACK